MKQCFTLGIIIGSAYTYLFTRIYIERKYVLIPIDKYINIMKKCRKQKKLPLPQSTFKIDPANLGSNFK